MIFFENLKFGPNTDMCTTSVFKQSELVRLLDLQNPDLILALVAIVGERYNLTLPFLYHGGIKRNIEQVYRAQGIELKDRSCYLKHSRLLRAHKFQSFKDFMDGIASNIVTNNARS